MISPDFLQHFTESILYTLLGIAAFGVAFLLMARLAPFSMRKEIEDDQNTALGIIVGSVMIGLSIIIAAAIGG